jgi:hypothetical protein
MKEVSTDRKLAWLGIGLSLLGLIPIFRDANTQLIVAYCLLFVALTGAFVYVALRTSGPQFTTILIKKILTIEDRAGATASLVREHTFRVNYGSIQEIWCRGIYADGTMDAFKVDGKDVPPSDRVSEGATLALRKRFPDPIFSDHEERAMWSYIVHDSFPAEQEALDHEVIPGTKLVELTVILPADRTCIAATTHIYAGGEAVGQEPDPEVSPDRRTITAKVKSPKSGHTVRLGWKW